MNIFYLAFVRLPTEKAHGLQIMKTCEALARTGAKVELVVPARRNRLTDDPFAFYAVERNFTLTQLVVPDLVHKGTWGFFATLLWFAEKARWMRGFWKADVVYSRDALVLAQYILLGRRLVWESHDGVWNLWARLVCHFAKAVVVVSEGLRRFYIEQGVSERKIFVIRNGIDLVSFAHAESKEASRARLGIPQHVGVALYAGALDGWKGAETLLAASAFLPAGTRLAVIGGEGPHVEELKQTYPSVIFLGFRPQRELADNLAAADVLVLPNTGKSGIATRFTSPLKLLAYMASRRPIVATDLPSTRELVDERSAFLVPPDDPQTLAQGISQALSDPAAMRRAEAAYAAVAAFTWDARARGISALAQKL